MKTIINSAMPREREGVEPREREGVEPREHEGIAPCRVTGLLVELFARGVPIASSLIGLIKPGNKPF
jgi:hypothetical protein